MIVQETQFQGRDFFMQTKGQKHHPTCKASRPRAPSSAQCADCTVGSPSMDKKGAFWNLGSVLLYNLFFDHDSVF